MHCARFVETVNEQEKIKIVSKSEAVVDFSVFQQEKRPLGETSPLCNYNLGH